MKIDFQKILHETIERQPGWKESTVYFPDEVILAMKSACNQVLDEAAEQAKTKRVELHGGRVVDKQSILKIKEEL